MKNEMKVFYDRKLSSVMRALEAGSPGRPFTEAMVEGLPPAAQRHLIHAIKPGTPLASSVRLKMHGSIRLKPDMAWMPMRAEQVISVPRGYVWKATAGKGLLRMGGGDYYLEGDACVRFWLWDIIPVVNSGGPDVARSAAGRLAVEAVLFPPAFLPLNGALWELVDDRTATASVKVGQETAALTLSVGPSGELQQVGTQRWGDKTDDGSFGYIPFGGTLGEERDFDGYTIPSRLNVRWWYGTERQFDFFQAEIDEAEFS